MFPLAFHFYFEFQEVQRVHLRAKLYIMTVLHPTGGLFIVIDLVSGSLVDVLLRRQYILLTSSM